ncbi:MAG: molybdopterin-dependent oxidoreductase [Anaerolineae bacterium]|nr:MAG: molybdopterin-dependent oxidoreductase [Anaerolineae bacterium]
MSLDRKRIEFHLNGEPVEIEIGPKTTLLQVLRDELRLLGTKNGCNHGRCGACTVIVTGQAQRACIILARRVEGKHVETIENLARYGELHPLQRAFIEQGAVQCGFCTPGLIMSAKALLDRKPRPSRKDILEALEPNLCRCTGYNKIVEAVEAAANELRAERGLRRLLGTKPLPPRATDPSLRAVGHSIVRPDARAKVTGAPIFTDDLYFEGMLHARALRSQYPHARILRVNADQARRLPGVTTVLTADDVPGEKHHGLVVNDWPVLAYDKVRYVGDAVALVAAESVAIAEQALSLIAVDYDPLPVVESVVTALKADAPRVHQETENGNLLKHIEVRKGNVEEGLAQSDVVLENVYQTPMGDHVFLEPECSVATCDADGCITVYVGSQIPFADRQQIAASLALPEKKVRVVHMAVGGGFGGKEDIAGQIHAALLAQATGRPVKLTYTRQESLIAHPKRHATIIRLKTGASHEGRLKAIEAHILGDAGAYASLSDHVMTRAATHAAGPYDVPHVKIDCDVLYTNNPPAGAYRGFGATQVQFAAETQIDFLAERLGMSPFAIRQANALRAGGITATGQRLTESVGLPETIEQVRIKVRELAGADATAARLPPDPNKRRGWGIACAYKSVGLGGGTDDVARAVVEVTDTGTVRVRAGAAEIGQGLVTVLVQIAAEVLGTDPAQVEVVLGHTDQTADCGPTTASRQTYVTGNAVRLAAEGLRQGLAATAAEELNAAPDSLVFEDGRVIRPDGHSMSFGEAASLARRQGRSLKAFYEYRAPTTAPLGQPGDAHFAYGFGTQAAQVEVDLTTGEVKVLRVVAAHDVGRAVNPMAVEGQIEGGIMMGIGYALTEEFLVEEGYVKSDNLARYKVPSIRYMPKVHPIILEYRASEGPFGAKGVGEVTTIPTAPAILNAIYHACGARLTHLPATPQRVLAALRK